MAETADPHHSVRTRPDPAASPSLEDLETAERELGAVCERFPDDPELWSSLAAARWDVGRHEAALAAIDRALTLAPSAPFAVHKGWMLFKTGKFAQAEATLTDAIARFPDGNSAYQNLAQVYKAWERWADGAAAAERACAENPADFDMRESWISCLLAADRPHEAIDTIERGLELFAATPAVFQLLMRKAGALQQLGDVESAIDTIAEAIALQPGDEGALDELCYLMAAKSRRREEAKPFRARLRDVQARQLPDRLADGLAMIWERTADVALDEGAVEWAWELADKSAWDRGAWQTAAAWGKEASLLLRRWWQTMPTAALGQLDELVDKPDMSKLFAASIEREACFLIGAHVGPMAALVNMFARGNRPFRAVGSPDRDRLDDETVIPVIPNSVAVMRAIMAQIRDGATIGITADDPTYTRHRLSLKFLGRQVELPAPVPKLIRRYDAASFWCNSLWRNGRIVIELEPLPDYAQDEPRDAWIQRWFAAYLGKLEIAMRGRPENLGLYSGIWANVNRTVIRERHRRPLRAGANEEPNIERT